MTRAVSGNIRWRDMPDSCRSEAEDAIGRYSAGMPMEGSLNVNGRWVARWCDIRDMWIEEA